MNPRIQLTTFSPLSRTKLDQTPFTKSNFHLTPNTTKAFRDAFSTNPILRPLYHTEGTLDEILAGVFH